MFLSQKGTLWWSAPDVYSVSTMDEHAGVCTCLPTNLPTYLQADRQTEMQMPTYTHAQSTPWNLAGVCVCACEYLHECM